MSQKGGQVRRREGLRWTAIAVACGVAAVALGGSTERRAGRPGDESWHPVFFGVDVPLARVTLVEAFTKRLGVRPTVSSIFIRYDSTVTAEVVVQTGEAGLTPFVTLEPWHLDAEVGHTDPEDSLAALLSGRYDDELLRQGRALASFKGTIYLRFAHEMNGNWYPWGCGVNGNTAAQYVRAWRHVHALFAERVPSLDARWVFAPNILSSPAISSDLDAFYPGDDVVDVLGLTGYEHRGSNPDRTLGPTVRALSRVGPQPIVLAEIGVEGPGKEAWLGRLGRYILDTSRIEGFVYFDTTPETTGATGHYALSPQDQPALRASLQELGLLTS